MKASDALKLQTGEQITHKRYGLCAVRNVHKSCGELFGVVVRPVTDEGRNLMSADFDTDIPDFMETSVRQLATTVAIAKAEGQS